MSAKTARTTLRLDPALKRDYEELAAADHRNLNQIIELALQLAKPQIRERIAVLNPGFLGPVAA